MSKSKILIGGSVLIITILIAGVFLISRKKETKPANAPSLQTTQKETKTEELLDYEDEAGFTFKYPSSLDVVDKSDSDPNAYSLLELSSKEYPGQILDIKINDTTSTTVDKWLSKNNQTGNVIASDDVSLGGMEGKILTYANPSKKLVLVIQNGILYQLETSSDRVFWNQALQTITSSFQLTSDQSSASNNSASSTDDINSGSVIDEGEEVVE